MARLLVSVRNVAEARAALTGGADLVDVKEPERGPLGAADEATIAAVVDFVAGRVPTSAALGELGSGRGLQRGGQCPDYAKFGLSGCASQDDWLALWRGAIDRLPAGVAPVAVAYADWRAAGAPDPASILSAAPALGCAALLIDTFDKNAGSLCDHLSMQALQQLVEAAHAEDMLVVLAGRLDERAATRLVPLNPDYIGVRGAVCSGGRSGRLDRVRVWRLAALVRGGVPINTR